MTLWRLEWLRLVRTHRLLVLLAVYLFFGALGPLTARYLQDIVARFGEGVQITAPAPRPSDGIAQFVANASQLGLLVTVLLAAAALSFDAQRENAVFLRTRVPTVRDLVLVKYLVTTAAVGGSFAVGSLLAGYETRVLIGPFSATSAILGTALGVLYLAFAVAVVALVAAFTQSGLSTALGSLGFLLLLAIIGTAVGPARQWLPSALVGAFPDLVAGGSPTTYVPAVLVTLLLTVLALWAAVRRSARREL